MFCLFLVKYFILFISQMRELSSERLSNLCRVTQLVSGSTDASLMPKVYSDFRPHDFPEQRGQDVNYEARLPELSKACF